jgi:FKBP-type peptidyl-prolyl cis-trans isomerase (trigger factor)
VRTRFKDQIRTEVLRELIPDAVQHAIAENKLEPLGEPELNLEVAEGLEKLGEHPISFNVNVEVLPEIELGKYKGIEVARRVRPVKDEDVERVVEQYARTLRRSNRLKIVARRSATRSRRTSTENSWMPRTPNRSMLRTWTWCSGAKALCRR